MCVWPRFPPLTIDFRIYLYARRLSVHVQTAVLIPHPPWLHHITSCCAKTRAQKLHMTSLIHALPWRWLFDYVVWRLVSVSVSPVNILPFPFIGKMVEGHHREQMLGDNHHQRSPLIFLQLQCAVYSLLGLCQSLWTKANSDVKMSNIGGFRENTFFFDFEIY